MPRKGTWQGWTFTRFSVWSNSTFHELIRECLLCLRLCTQSWFLENSSFYLSVFSNIVNLGQLFVLLLHTLKLTSLLCSFRNYVHWDWINISRANYIYAYGKISDRKYTGWLGDYLMLFTFLTFDNLFGWMLCFLYGSYGEALLSFTCCELQGVGRCAVEWP